jgi:hypothetical protein
MNDKERMHPLFRKTASSAWLKKPIKKAISEGNLDQ